MADVYAKKIAARHAAAQGETARHTGRLADAHTRQAAALERIASALEALLDGDSEGAPGSGEQDHAPDLSDGAPDSDGKALPAGLCYVCQRPAEQHRTDPARHDET